VEGILNWDTFGSLSWTLNIKILSYAFTNFHWSVYERSPYDL
jgi:hypothetical protein